MINIFYKIKRLIRKKYIIYRYNRNFKSGNVIFLKQDDRGYGLSTLLIKDAIKYNIPILVPTKRSKIHMANKIYKYGQLGLISQIERDYAMKNLILTPTENIRGRKIDWIFVDNSCRDLDLCKFLNRNNTIYIANGFVTSCFMI